MCNFQCVFLVDTNYIVLPVFKGMNFFICFYFLLMMVLWILIQKHVLVVFMVYFCRFSLLVPEVFIFVGFRNCVSCSRNFSLKSLFLYFCNCLFCFFFYPKHSVFCLCGVNTRSYFSFSI